MKASQFLLLAPSIRSSAFGCAVGGSVPAPAGAALRLIGFRVLSLISLLLASSVAGAAPSDIWSQLQRGGYVLLMRHGDVDTLNKSTSPDADFEGCEGQYNLTELGRAQALVLGKMIKKKKIPVGGVLASPLCRTQDTARIAFGQFRAWSGLEPLPESNEEERAARLADMTKVIRDYRGRENLVLVTHYPNIDALTFEAVEPGTVVVLKPDAKSGFRVEAVLPAKSWLKR